jgi:hypothetical protein
MSVVVEEGTEKGRLLANQEEILADATAAAKARPTTFEELKQLPTTCKRCGNNTATHTLSLTVALLGQGRGSTVTTLPRVPVCEGCAVKVFVVVKDALKS